MLEELNKYRKELSLLKKTDPELAESLENLPESWDDFETSYHIVHCEMTNTYSLSKVIFFKGERVIHTYPAIQAAATEHEITEEIYKLNQALFKPVLVLEGNRYETFQVQ